MHPKIEEATRVPYDRGGHVFIWRTGRGPVHLAACPCWRKPARPVEREPFTDERERAEWAGAPVPLATPAPALRARRRRWSWIG